MSASEQQRCRDRELVLLGMAIGNKKLSALVNSQWVTAPDVREAVQCLQQTDDVATAAKLRALGLDWDQTLGLANSLLRQIEWLHLVRDAAMAAKMLAVAAKSDLPDPKRVQGFVERIERVTDGKHQFSGSLGPTGP